jgi:hypothetical protein
MKVSKGISSPSTSFWGRCSSGPWQRLGLLPVHPMVQLPGNCLLQPVPVNCTLHSRAGGARSCCLVVLEIIEVLHFWKYVIHLLGPKT